MRKTKPLIKILPIALQATLLAGFPVVVFDLPAMAEDIKSQFPDIGGSTGGAPNYAGFNPAGINQNGPGPNNFNPNNFNAGNFNPVNFQAGGFNAPGDESTQALLRKINFDPRKMVRPDKFADHPSIDASGGRHFGNGRHYDLSSTSVKSAVAQLNASDEQIMQQALQRQQIRQNGGRAPF